MSEINFYNIDNIEFMKTKPDNYYDLAIVDPPYGISASSGDIPENNKKWQKKTKNLSRMNRAGKLANRAINQDKCTWDSCPPTKEYFDEVMRVSENQIIWTNNVSKTWLLRDSTWSSTIAKYEITSGGISLDETTGEIVIGNNEYLNSENHSYMMMVFGGSDD